MTPPVKYGLYFFAVSSAIALIQYLINPELLFNPIFATLLSFALPIIFIVLSIRADRADEAGYTMGEGIKAGMITFGIGTFLGTVFMYILANVIDPGLNDQAIEFAKDLAVKASEAMSGLLGADEADQARMLEELEKQDIPSPYSATQLGLGWVIGLIFPGLIISLIAAAIMKKN